MKVLILALTLFLNNSIFGSRSIREVCENAYYATDYVELHEYDVTVDWSRLSDHGHVELESVIFGETFSLLGTRELSNGKTVYSIKEVPGYRVNLYRAGLEVLQRLTFKGVDCRPAL
jgi:hypothetical protein